MMQNLAAMAVERNYDEIHVQWRPVPLSTAPNVLYGLNI